MKKFSKSTHQTVSELNVTPMLDLAFVLLVIFIITTAPVVNDLDQLDLPSATRNQKDPKPKVNYVTVDREGQVFLNRQRMELPALLPALTELRTADADLNVVVRGDGKTKYRFVVGVLDVLQQANIGKVNLATEPRK